MSMLVQLVGVLIVAPGLVALLDPEHVRGWLGWWQSGQRLRTGGLLKAIFGVVLVAGASGSRWPAALTVIGGLAVAGGLLAAVTGPGPIAPALQWCQGRPRPWLRAWGVVATAIGLLVVAAAS